ncbi:MAG TPA: hypothetical protein VK932_20040 [Kofleriaceae bacterium]|nr:hypothetical protein [Kofleriaceae bacterium]
MRLGVLTLLASVLACKGGDRDRPGGEIAAGSAGAGAGPASATAPGEPRGNRAAEPEGPTGEVFHATDRKSTQGFGRGDLAVGGGWIYWIERPRIDHDGKSVVRRKPAGAPAADRPPVEPETVAGPGRIHAIAADAERLYVAGDALESRPHAGGAPSPVAAGAWLEIVPGDKHLLIRSREQVALVPKAGGAVETVWEGKHSKLAVDADGDRFIAIPVSPWAQKSAARAITAFAPGAKPAVIAELAEARGDLAIDGDWIYFSGQAGAASPAPPLWRIPRAGGTPERIGDPSWGFGELVIRKGVLYGMVFTGAWKLQKLALAPGAAPVALEGRVPSMIQALATDDAHLYYLTDFEVKRAPR